MKLNKMERMAMNFFDYGNVEYTIQRLCIAAMLSPKQEIKEMFCGLIGKLRKSRGETEMMVTEESELMKGKYSR